MKWTRIAALLVVGIFAVGACSSDDDGGAIDTGDQTGTSDDATATTAADDGADDGGDAGGNAVSIKGFAFNPTPLTVAVGSTVKWTNGDGAAHTVTADDEGGFDHELSAGSTFEQEFSEAGTFDYHCNIHTSMKGQIVVQ